MKRIDAHQHFWLYNKQDFDWVTDDMHKLRSNFLPRDLKPLLDENNIDGCVAIQTNQTLKENDFLLQLAAENNFIKGIVGWVNLMSEDVEIQLSSLQQHKKFKGVRHILQGEKNRSLMLTNAFKNGISLLSKFNFTYDILIYADQLPFAFELAKTFPDQKFVIDHLAKPFIKGNEKTQWTKDISVFKNCENVYCKISGMVNEANWKNHSPKTFAPYLDVVTEVFGTDKIMFGSDWPVCLVAADSYKEVLLIIEEYFQSFSTNEIENIFGENAAEFYNL